MLVVVLITEGNQKKNSGLEKYDGLVPQAFKMLPSPNSYTVWAEITVDVWAILEVADKNVV